jgi:hypothetical protein
MVMRYKIKLITKKFVDDEDHGYYARVIESIGWQEGPNHSNFHENLSKMKSWCIDSCDDSVTFPMHNVFRFEKEEDATMFILRFGV